MKLYTESRERELEEQGVIHIELRIRPRRLIAILLVLAMHGLVFLFTFENSCGHSKWQACQWSHGVHHGKSEAGEKGRNRAEENSSQISKRQKTVQRKRLSLVRLIPDAIIDPNLPAEPPKKYEDAVPDMAAMLNAARERRQKAEAAAAAEIARPSKANVV